jgi:hypothetical protein
MRKACQYRGHGGHCGLVHSDSQRPWPRCPEFRGARKGGKTSYSSRTCCRRGFILRREIEKELEHTEAPLDLDNPAHLDALKRAYERFPVIGGRDSP